MPVSFGTKFIQFGYLDGHSQMFKKKEYTTVTKIRLKLIEGYQILLRLNN